MSNELTVRNAESSRLGNVTEEHLNEAKKLNAIWKLHKMKFGESQASFGLNHDIGTQSAVSQFLLGITPLTLKAAIGFSKGLRCEIEAFSPRLARMRDAVNTGDISENVAARIFSSKRFTQAKNQTDLEILKQIESLVFELGVNQAENERKLAAAQASLDFYKQRFNLLSQWLTKMRDPEQSIVRDILASCSTLVEIKSDVSEVAEEACSPGSVEAKQ